MKFNTITQYVMKAQFRSWEPHLQPVSSLTYRKYATVPEEVPCTIIVSPIGAVSLFTDHELQLFGIIHDIEDAAGTPVMQDFWYSIQKITPIINSAGYVAGYKHNIAILAADLISRPIDPPVNYPDLDQVQ